MRSEAAARKTISASAGLQCHETQQQWRHWWRPFQMALDQVRFR